MEIKFSLGLKHPFPSLILPPLLQAAAAGEVTVAVYTFSHEKGEPMPYRVKIPSTRVTLRHVKDFLPKKGAFRSGFNLVIIVTTVSI